MNGYLTRALVALLLAVFLYLQARAVSDRPHRRRMFQLAALASHPRIVYTRERLLEKVWGYQSGVGSKTVDVHVANLRRKLGDDIGIVAVRGVGYKLEPEG